MRGAEAGSTEGLTTMMKSAYVLVPALVLAMTWQASAACPPDCPVGGKIKFRTARNPHLTIETDKSAAAALPLSGSPGPARRDVTRLHAGR